MLSLAEVGDGISKVVTVCVFLYLGVLLAGRLFAPRPGPAQGAAIAPRITGWLRLNVAIGLLILFNNVLAAYQSLSGGYLDIYSAQSLSPVKTITVLPIYVFTLFYLYLSWTRFRHAFSRSAARTLLWMFGAIVVSFVFTGSRSTVIYLLVSLAAVYSVRFQRKVWKYAPHAVALVVGSTVVGVLREGGFAAVDSSTLVLRPIMELGNTAIVFLTSESISGELTVSVVRYIAGLLYLFPVSLLAALGIVPPPLLSQQYVSIVDPGWSDMGGGFGFSLVAEIYLLGGVAGAWLVALLIGVVLGWIDANFRSTNIPKAALAASLGFLMLFIVRGEVMELYRNVFVVFVLYLISTVSARGGSAATRS
jgi:oligosaccharide repeat unit polymerase